MLVANSHLWIEQTILRAGAEITPSAGSWIHYRVCFGTGYLLTGDKATELNAGDVVVAPPGPAFAIRASQLGSLALCHFALQLEQLRGLLTLPELRVIELGTGRNGLGLRLVPSDDPLAREFACVCQHRTSESGMVVRGEMVLLALRSLSATAATGVEAPAECATAKGRLIKLASRMPESELLRHSPAELARLCGCTERHLRRIFRQFFGTSLQGRQMDYRILMARRLLAETDAKVIDVAQECGFRHLGLFNATFKRLVGRTPSDCRKATRNKLVMRRRSREIFCPNAPGDPPRNGQSLREHTHRSSAATAQPANEMRGPLMRA
jgi:AraC-like DNA-binding protein